MPNFHEFQYKFPIRRGRFQWNLLARHGNALIKDGKTKVEATIAMYVKLKAADREHVSLENPSALSTGTSSS
jgi:hypothetical protein